MALKPKTNKTNNLLSFQIISNPTDTCIWTLRLPLANYLESVYMEVTLLPSETTSLFSENLFLT